MTPRSSSLAACLAGWSRCTSSRPANLYALVLRIQATSRINSAFGKGNGMTVLAMVLPPLWATILAGSQPCPSLAACCRRSRQLSAPGGIPIPAGTRARPQSQPAPAQVPRPLPVAPLTSRSSRPRRSRDLRRGASGANFPRISAQRRQRDRPSQAAMHAATPLASTPPPAPHRANSCHPPRPALASPQVPATRSPARCSPQQWHRRLWRRRR